MQDSRSHQLTAPLGPGKASTQLQSMGWMEVQIVPVSGLLQVHVLAAAALMAASLMIAAGSRSRTAAAR